MSTENLTTIASREAKEALFLEEIKSATSHQHIELGLNKLLLSIISQDVTRHQYYSYLLLMQAVAKKYETTIATRLTFLFPNQKAISKLIADDLKSIIYMPKKTVKLSECVLSGEESSISFALGFMYVMEGAKTGGKVIFNHIRKILGYYEDEGARFIADYGSDTVGVWKTFMSRFAAYVVAHQSEAEAIAGARTAYSSILHFFENNRKLYDN